jgi:hypothetical protein
MLNSRAGSLIIQVADTVQERTGLLLGVFQRVAIRSLAGVNKLLGMGNVGSSPKLRLRKEKPNSYGPLTTKQSGVAQLII